jgi:acyl-CoA dehydrogenase
MAIGNAGFLLIIVLACSLAYFQTARIVWSLVLACALIVLSVFATHLSITLLIIAWLIFLAAAGFVWLGALRRKYVMGPMALSLQKNMPAISATEREAIEAGHVWWEKDLFRGRPDWQKLFTIPAPTLTAEENSFLTHQVDALCAMLNDWQINHIDHDLSPEVWQYLKDEKFFGLSIPKEYGGLGFSALLHSTTVMKIATRSVSAAVNTMVPNSLGPAELLLHYGTSAQKDYYLPRLAAGTEIPCFALTSPEAGSDAGAMTDSGVVCREMIAGKEVLGIKLNWDKRYITLAPIATLLGLAFKLYDPERLLSNKTDLGITLCLVPTNLPGVEIGHRHLPMYLAFMNGPTRGKNVFVPIDAIIGGINMAGQGWRMLMECLSVGRAISLPALSTACGKVTYRLTGAYATIRKQFNTSIANFEGIEESLSDIAGYTYLLESCRIMTVGAVDLQIKPAIASAIAKYNMTEMARHVVSHAMDIHAGHMIQAGPSNFLANAHLAIPVSITVEGANILTRNLIIFGQGAIRCHPYVLDEIKLFAANQNNAKLPELDKILLAHGGYLISNVVRTLWFGLTAGKLIFPRAKGINRKHCQQITRMSSALALLADLVMLILGGGLKRKERISARLGDMLSQLYLATTVLKYFNDREQPATDVNYVNWCVAKCLHAAQIACDELLSNFPIKWLGKLLRVIIFPWGLSYQRPSDLLAHKIVAPMLSPSVFRDRLTEHFYLDPDKQSRSNQLEQLLMQSAAIEPVSRKLHKAWRDSVLPQANITDALDLAVKMGIVLPKEGEAFAAFDKLRKQVIQVNEFSFDLKTVIK